MLKAMSTLADFLARFFFFLGASALFSSVGSAAAGVEEASSVGAVAADVGYSLASLSLSLTVFLARFFFSGTADAAEASSSVLGVSLGSERISKDMAASGTNNSEARLRVGRAVFFFLLLRVRLLDFFLVSSFYSSSVLASAAGLSVAVSGFASGFSTGAVTWTGSCSVD